MPSPTVTAPAANLTSGQFINVEKLHIAKMLTDVPNGAATEFDKNKIKYEI